MSITKDIAGDPSIISATSVFYFLLMPTMLLWFVYWRLSRKHLYDLSENIPGIPGYPLIGNLMEVLGSPHPVFNNVIKKAENHTKLVKLWLGPKLLIFLFNPDDIELVLSSQVHIDKSPDYKFFKPWLGDGLLISTGHKWRSHRKLIAPTFHLNVLKSFIDLFNENSRYVVEKLKKEGPKTFDAHDYMSEATVEILLETAMGVSKKTQDKSGYEYALAVMKMCDIIHMRSRGVIYRSDFIFSLTKAFKEQGRLLDIIHRLTSNVIKSKNEAFKKGQRGSLAYVSKSVQEDAVTKQKQSQTKDVSVEGLSFGQSEGLKDDLDVDMPENDIGEKKRLAFLDLLLESRQNGALITDTEIKEQVDTIMFEGHDTTAAASSFFLSLMGVHQHIQDKVFAELYEIFGDSDRPCTFQDTLEMKYFERCLMETLRMYPPVPIIARQVQEDIKLKSGPWTIPKGSSVIVATYKLHRNPEIYPNPDVFNPDNFLPENQAKRHYYAFVPFSAGPRSCVGRKYAMLKLKILLSTILRNYRVYSDLKEKDFRLQADIILKREEGFKVRLGPRQQTVKA